MLTCQRDFTKVSPYKNTIEKILYSRARMVSHVDGITGPDIGRHIKNYRNYVAISGTSVIRVIDIDKDVHKQQIEWQVKPGVSTWHVREESDTNIWADFVGIESTRERVSLIHTDIENIQNPARFFDADLMGTIDGPTGHAIETILSKQAKFYSSDEARKLKKALVFTFSVRKSGESRTIEWIEDLVGRKLNSICSIGGKSLFTLPRATGITTNGYKGTSVHKYNCKFIKRGRIEDICMFYYNEGNSPMLTGIIVYR